MVRLVILLCLFVLDVMKSGIGNGDLYDMQSISAKSRMGRTFDSTI